MLWLMGLLPVALLMLGFPFFIVLLSTATLAIVLFTSVPPVAVLQTMFGAIGNFALLAVPFFIFAGELMARGGMARRLVAWCWRCSAASAARRRSPRSARRRCYGAISGSTAATVAALGPMFYPQLRKAGYSEKFSAGHHHLHRLHRQPHPAVDRDDPVLRGGRAVGDQAVRRRHHARPHAGGADVALSSIATRASPASADVQPFRWDAFVAALREGVLAIGAPVVIFGGIYGGVFSPTEAAGVACVYVVVVTMFVYREIGWRELWDVTGQLDVPDLADLPDRRGRGRVLLAADHQRRAAALPWHSSTHLDLQPWMVLLVINVFLLIVGCFIDPASAILILTPLLLPIATAIGIDPIHFGIIVTVNLSIGTFTPPFGVNIFVAQSIFRVPLSSIYAGVTPFIAVTVLGLMIITYWPACRSGWSASSASASQAADCLV